MKLTKSEKRVIEAISKRDHKIILTHIGEWDKRCSNAINALKKKRIIYRNPSDCILYLCTGMQSALPQEHRS